MPGPSRRAVLVASAATLLPAAGAARQVHPDDATLEDLARLYGLPVDGLAGDADGRERAEQLRRLLRALRGMDAAGVRRLADASDRMMGRRSDAPLSSRPAGCQRRAASDDVAHDGPG